MISRPIKEKDFNLILKLDKKVYPTDSPVKQETIKKWYSNNPEFALIYEENKKITGLCIAIPMKADAWNKFIKGKIIESELNEKTIFRNSENQGLGIHIYHIEKLNKTIEKFYEKCFKDLAEIVRKMKKENKKLELTGISALCTTEKGINLFSKLNFKEKNFFCKEYVIKEKGKKKVINAKTMEKLKKTSKNLKQTIRCKMLVLTPEQKSILWDYFRE